MITHLFHFFQDEGVASTTIGYERRRDVGNAPDIHVNVKETSSQCKYI